MRLMVRKRLIFICRLKISILCLRISLARSGFKTIEDRGLTLEEGRFGKGLKMNLIPSIVEQDEMTGIDLDTVTAVVFNTRHRRDVWVGYNEPFLWGAGKLNPGSGSLAFWVKGTFNGG